jgi:hypothetical protein
MPTFLGTPEKVAIFNGSTDAPFDNPLGNLGNLKFHSQLAYLPFLPARTITASVSVPSSAAFRRTIDLGPHGQAGVPFIYGLVSGIPFVGTIPIHVAASARTAICWTLCVDASNVFIAEQRANPLNFSAVTSPRTVTVYVSSKLAA